jgi:hypothetical protein
MILISFFYIRLIVFAIFSCSGHRENPVNNPSYAQHFCVGEGQRKEKKRKKWRGKRKEKNIEWSVLDVLAERGREKKKKKEEGDNADKPPVERKREKRKKVQFYFLSLFFFFFKKKKLNPVY